MQSCHPDISGALGVSYIWIGLGAYRCISSPKSELFAQASGIIDSNLTPVIQFRIPASARTIKTRVRQGEPYY